MSRPVTVLAVRVKEARKRNVPWRVLSRIESGVDARAWLYAFADALPSADLVDTKYQRYLNVESVAKVRHGALITALAGPYGEPGVVRNVTSGQDRHRHGRDDAPVLTVRTLLFFPPDSTVGLAFVEHANRASARKVVDELKRRWVDSDVTDGWTLDLQQVVHASAWLEHAQLEGVTALSYGHESDRADSVASGADGMRLGTMKYVLVPDRGVRYLPKKLYELLTHSHDQAERARILGIQLGDDEQLDEVKVTVGTGSESKTYVIDHERTPPVRLDLGEAAGDTSSGEGFTAFCHGAARDFFPPLGEDWQTRWLP